MKEEIRKMKDDIMSSQQFEKQKVMFKNTYLVDLYIYTFFKLNIFEICELNILYLIINLINISSMINKYKYKIKKYNR